MTCERALKEYNNVRRTYIYRIKSTYRVSIMWWAWWKTPLVCRFDYFVCYYNIYTHRVLHRLWLLFFLNKISRFTLFADTAARSVDRGRNYNSLLVDECALFRCCRVSLGLTVVGMVFISFFFCFLRPERACVTLLPRDPQGPLTFRFWRRTRSRHMSSRPLDCIIDMREIHGWTNKFNACFVVVIIYIYVRKPRAARETEPFSWRRATTATAACILSKRFPCTYT